MNNFSGSKLERWSSCLAPGLGMIKAEEHCLLEYLGQKRRPGSGWVSLYVRGMLLAEPSLRIGQSQSDLIHGTSTSNLSFFNIALVVYAGMGLH